MAAYRSTPVPSKKMPGGIPFIIGNEAAERFSFYGMKGILVIFMTRYLMGSDGELAVMEDAEAVAYYHLFTAAVYFTPLFGALLADVFLGKYPTILSLSVVYCLGHLALALDDTRFGLALGLGLIALGSGGIKPCVSAHVGDQFGKTNAHLLEGAFSYFYFAINLGAFASMIATPLLLDRLGPHVAFGVPGGLMLLATWVFWLGRWKFIHVPPNGKAFIAEATSREGLSALGRLAIIYTFVAMFWALFDQTGSSWVLQAREMDRVIFGVEVLESQIQSVNPLLVMLLVPFFLFVVYPLARRVITVTPLRKIGAGFAVMVGTFLLTALIQVWIDRGENPSIGWQLLAYVILTSSEVLVSVTCLEFSYTQAPKALKSLVMALFLMSVSIGNLFTSAVNFVIQSGAGAALEGPSYFLFFAALMAITTMIYIPVARRFPVHSYIQEEGPEEEAIAEAIGAGGG